jgi:hypothetical protein
MEKNTRRRQIYNLGIEFRYGFVPTRDNGRVADSATINLKA